MAASDSGRATSLAIRDSCNRATSAPPARNRAAGPYGFCQACTYSITSSARARSVGGIGCPQNVMVIDGSMPREKLLWPARNGALRLPSPHQTRDQGATVRQGVNQFNV